MSTSTPIKELKNMKPEDLQAEIASQKLLVASLRMAVKLQKEKDTAKYQRAKKDLARMETVYSEKTTEKLQQSSAKSTVSAAQS